MLKKELKPCCRWKGRLKYYLPLARVTGAKYSLKKYRANKEDLNYS